MSCALRYTVKIFCVIKMHIRGEVGTCDLDISDEGRVTNIVSGNLAGTFAGFLAHLSWMEVASKHSNIKLFLHARNKTSHPGNCYSNYRWFESSQVLKEELDDALSINILFDVFKPNDFMTTEKYPDSFTYYENFPFVNKLSLPFYPQESLKYDGRGQWLDQYLDKEALQKTRDALNIHWSKFSFTDSFQTMVDKEEQLIKGKKVFTVMIRQSAHYVRYESRCSDVIDAAVSIAKEKIDDYDGVLLTTQIQPFVDRFKQEFGDKVITTERPRLARDTDWVGGRNEAMTDAEYLAEIQNAFLDVILTSKTDHVVAASSNMFLTALIMNPKITYELFLVSDGL